MDIVLTGGLVSSVGLLAIGLALLARAPAWGALASLSGAAPLSVLVLTLAPRYADTAALAALLLWPAAFVAAAYVAVRAARETPDPAALPILLAAGLAALASALPFAWMEVDAPPLHAAAERIVDASFAAYACALAALVALLGRRHAQAGAEAAAAAWLAIACASLAAVALGRYLIVFGGSLSDVVPTALFVGAALVWILSAPPARSRRALGIALALAALPLAGMLAGRAGGPWDAVSPAARLFAAAVFAAMLRPSGERVPRRDRRSPPKS